MRTTLELSVQVVIPYRTTRGYVNDRTHAHTQRIRRGDRIPELVEKAFQTLLYEVRRAYPTRL